MVPDPHEPLRQVPGIECHALGCQKDRGLDGRRCARVRIDDVFAGWRLRTDAGAGRGVENLRCHAVGTVVVEVQQCRDDDRAVHGHLYGLVQSGTGRCYTSNLRLSPNDDGARRAADRHRRRTEESFAVDPEIKTPGRKALPRVQLGQGELTGDANIWAETTTGARPAQTILAHTEPVD